MPRVWKISAGRDAVFIDEFVSSSIVAIGWSSVGDLSNVHGGEAIRSLVERAYPNDNRYQLSSSTGQISRFRDDLIQGELVLVYDPNSRIYHTGTIVGDYQYRPDLPDEMKHTRPVMWGHDIVRDSLTIATRNSLGAIATIFCVSQAAQDEIQAILSGTPSIVANASDAVDLLQEAEAETRRNTEESAFEFLQDRIDKLDWSQMQDLVASLLRAMGYKTQVSPPGPDRGKDIFASPDGFGFQEPRIVVEVKHREGSMGAPKIRAFIGGLRRNDNGLYVSTGGFTREARYEAERATYNVTLMDADLLGRTIIEHYDSMDSDGRALLPMRKIYWPI